MRKDWIGSISAIDDRLHVSALSLQRIVLMNFPFSREALGLCSWPFFTLALLTSSGSAAMLLRLMEDGRPVTYVGNLNRGVQALAIKT